MRRTRTAGAILCLGAQLLTLRPGPAGAGSPGNSTEPTRSLLLLREVAPAGEGAAPFSSPPEEAEGRVDSLEVRGASESSAEAPRLPLWASGEHRSPKWGIVGSAVGLVAGVGLALRIKSEADQRYEAYLTIADPDEARRRLDAAERYDRAALIGWVMAQVSFVGLIYFLTREGKHPLVPVKGEPVIRPSRDGVQVGLEVRP